MHFHLKRVLVPVYLSCLMALTACSENNEGEKGSPFIKVKDVSTNGCLNLKLLNDRIRKFPRNTSIRAYTPSIDVTGSSEIAKLAALKGIFRFDMIKPTEALFLAEDVRQLGCEKIGFLDEDQNEEDYIITNYSQEEVSFSRNDEKIFRIRLDSNQSISVEHTYKTFNDCGANEPLQIKVITVYKWGNDSFNAFETISDSTYSKLKIATSDTVERATPKERGEEIGNSDEPNELVPEGELNDISANLLNETENGWTEVPIQELMLLQSLPSKPNIRACSPNASKPISVNPDDTPEEEDDQWGDGA